MVGAGISMTGEPPWTREELFRLCCDRSVLSSHKTKRSRVANSREQRIRLYALLDRYRSQPCKDCGLAFPPYVMDFDHRDGTTKVMCVTTMAARNFGRDKILAEISKCDVICASCHKARTYKRGQVGRRVKNV